MKLGPDSLAGHLAGALLPAYLVSGEEPLLAGEAADSIRAAARRRGFTERDVHFVERATDWENLRASSGNLSLFAARRLIEVRMPGGKPGIAGAKTLLALLGRPDPDTLLLVLTERLDATAQAAEWVRAIEQRGGWVAVPRVPPQRLPEWLRARCRRAGLDADPAAIELLAARTEGNLLAADQEIAKLALRVGGGRLDAAAVLDGVLDSARYGVFEFGSALGLRDAPRALRVLAGLRAEGEEPPLVLWAALQALRRLPASGPASPQPAGRAATAGTGSVEPRPGASRDRLVARALRVDRMIKGRLQGDAWDELALFAVELCVGSVVPLPGPARA